MNKNTTPNDDSNFNNTTSHNSLELTSLLEQLRITNSQLKSEQRLKLAVIRLVIPNDLLIPEMLMRSYEKSINVVIDELFIEVANSLFPDDPK